MSKFECLDCGHKHKGEQRPRKCPQCNCKTFDRCK
ncbi:rubredoxin-like domain-containing protein [Proteinivorax tanatarense]|uniref:Rubredoxin-like domain-containing protein n=1 Tax=Proteinivorax tanatarense TaxID=1260629 RepID=A0AAU7VPU9_9FIRM